MKFFKYATMYDLMLKLGNVPDLSEKSMALVDREAAKFEKEDLDERNASLADREESALHLQSRQVAERVWVEDADRLYFKIWPDYVDMLANTSLNVAVRDVMWPAPAFSIRFPEKHPLELQDGTKVAAMMLSKFTYLYKGTDLRDDTIVLTWIKAEEVDKAIGSNLVFTFSAEATEGLTFANLLSGKALYAAAHECSLDSFPDDEFAERLRPMLRLAVAVMFLATGGEKYMDPDILNEDFKRYLAAVNSRDTSETVRLRTKAVNTYRSPGFVIGRREAVLGQRSYRVGKETPSADGTPLKYRHIRNAHGHNYWVGTGEARKLVPMFIPMIIVRPELPPHPDEKGYRTLRTKERMKV